MVSPLYVASKLYEPVVRGPWVEDGLPSATVSEKAGVPLQRPFVKKLNVTVPVMAMDPTWPLTEAVSYTEDPRATLPPFAMTLLSAALWSVVEVVVGAWTMENGSQALTDPW